MLAAATSAASAFFKVSAISQNYILPNANTTSIASGPSSRSASPAPSQSKSAPFSVGLWRVQEAVHKTNGRHVSVWSFDKKNSALDKLVAAAKERVMQVLKTEATALSRMRHPCILEMVEPLEETRSEFVFATDAVIATLAMRIPDSPLVSRDSEVLDEIETQKGILQLSKGLAFLHTSARLVHSNLTPDSVLVNSAGDWKLSGLGLTIPLLGPDGNPTRWEFPAYDIRIPPSIQRSFDYIAPEYALSEQIVTSSDMYSLGCVIYAVHAKGSPPFRNHNSLSSMRSNLGRLTSGGLINAEAWDSDLRNLVASLVTPSPSTRLSSETISSHAFFSSIAVSTLNFLDPSTFAPKPREEKIAFMKGLQTVLPRFSEGMRRRKVLPSILAEMKDPLLLPSILPNVFNISAALDATQFQQLVLPSLKPLFAVRDPPQNMIVLLENLTELQKKTAKNAFRSDVLPLVYNALESEHPAVQERALEAVPELCDTIDYAEVQGVLFPRVALIFTKTNILSVKISSLKSFLPLVKTLDQTSLTQKLVPLLAKIRTKEPAVMLATLAVHEAMGRKINREAIALHLLPQLWQMSMGPLLNVEQFARFMSVIRVLSERVEKEHAQHLRDAQRVEDRSAMTNGGRQNALLSGSGVDFESLVAGSNKATMQSASSPSISATSNGSANSDGWEDDVWGSIFGSDTQAPAQPFGSTVNSQTQSHSESPQSRLTPVSSGARRLGTRAVGPSLPLASKSSPTAPYPLSPSSTSASLSGSRPQNTLQTATHPLPPPIMVTPVMTSFPPSSQYPSTMSPTQSPFSLLQQQQQQRVAGVVSPPKPNYNISLEAAVPASPPIPNSLPPAPNNNFSPFPQRFSSPASVQNNLFAPLQPQSTAPVSSISGAWGQPQLSMVSMTPMMPTTKSTGPPKGGGKANKDLGGFDPLL